MEVGDVDADSGSVPEFIEDCEVCCRPILFSGFFDDRGRLRLTARSDS
jgi:hypothetical protein